MGGFAETFRDLDVYKGSLQLAADVHEYCAKLPTEERFAMADQMRRASRSICQNIAEAWRKRRYKPAFISKLSDAETEAGEMQSCLDLCLKFNYLTQENHDRWDQAYELIIKQLVAMSNQADKWCR